MTGSAIVLGLLFTGTKKAGSVANSSRVGLDLILRLGPRNAENRTTFASGHAMLAAVQQSPGTIGAAPSARPALVLIACAAGHQPATAPLSIMSVPVHAAREFIIQGITREGRVFRPSDWAERLAGAMSSFRPGAAGKAGIGAFIGYSPYCVPTSVGDVKAVIVNEALRDIEPMAWDFVTNFARDNALQMDEVCVLPEPLPALK
jgi:hypothetical protein